MTIKSILTDKKVKVKDLAKLFRFTPEATSLKLKRDYFTLLEIKLIKDTYHLTPDDILKIFF